MERDAQQQDIPQGIPIRRRREVWQPLSLFEFVIAVTIIVAAPIVFWFFYSIIAVRLGWESKDHR
jgi:hypothetical protein